MSTTLNEIHKYIQIAALSELDQLIRWITEVKAQKFGSNPETFHVDDIVQFSKRKGDIITGTVIRINIKTVTVDQCSDGHSYRVPFKMLSKVN